MTAEAKSPASVNQQKGKKRWNGKSQDEKSHAMAAVVGHRWNGVAQSEEGLRQYFETTALDTSLETYAVMRKQYEIAGKIIDQRVQEERSEEKCENCGKRFDGTNVWYNREAVRDDVTGTIRNVFSCSQACMIAIKGKGRKPRP